MTEARRTSLSAVGAFLAVLLVLTMLLSLASGAFRISLHDLLGITTDFSPRFLRRYLNLEEQIEGAVKQFCEDVRAKDFPNQDESY